MVALNRSWAGRPLRRQRDSCGAGVTDRFTRLRHTAGRFANTISPSRGYRLYPGTRMILIMPKRDKRIDSTRSCGRHVGGEQRHEHEQHGDGDER
jgi:hypothetical protein